MLLWYSAMTVFNIVFHIITTKFVDIIMLISWVYVIHKNANQC